MIEIVPTAEALRERERHHWETGRHEYNSTPLTRYTVHYTCTLTALEEELLGKIAAHRHPTDARVESQTLRELIREEWARIEREHKRRGE